MKSSKEQHLFKMEILCNIMHVFTASLPNKSIRKHSNGSMYIYIDNPMQYKKTMKSVFGLFNSLVLDVNIKGLNIRGQALS